MNFYRCPFDVLFKQFHYSKRMRWYQEEDDEDDLMFSPALLARRASESWIESPPVEVVSFLTFASSSFEPKLTRFCFLPAECSSQCHTTEKEVPARCATTSLRYWHDESRRGVCPWIGPQRRSPKKN